MAVDEWIKAKYNHSGDTLRNPLNIDLEINNENQQLIAVNQKGATDLCKYL
jgi:hypothetical protein